MPLTARVNDQLMQDESMSDMICDVPELISFCSLNFTLDAGDMILTGTPSGVGGLRTPPINLLDGDIVEVAVDGIGALRNTVWMIRRY